MIKKIVLTLVLASSALFSVTLTPEVKALLKEAKSEIKSVNRAELQDLIKEDKVILLDVRDPNEWEKGGIKAKRVVQISRGFMEVKYPKLILGKYKKDDAFVVFCAIEPRSVLATKRLQDLGFTNVKYLKGGLKKYLKD